MNLSKILSIIKIIAIVISILLVLGVGYLYKENKKLKLDNERVSNNFQNSQFLVDSMRTKSGQLEFFSKGVTLKVDELSQFNQKLVSDIEDMKLKINDLDGIATVNYNYNYFNDSSKITKITDTTFINTFTDKWLSMKEKLTIYNYGKNLRADSLNIGLTDSLLMPFQIDYKRVWIFWKRPIGVTVFVKSNNPHFSVNKIEYIKLIK